MVEPEDGDVAGGLAIVAFGPGEVGIDGSAVVPLVRVLDPELIRQEGVTTGGIHQEAGLPLAGAAIIVPRLHGDLLRVAVQVDARDLAAFHGVHALAGGVAEQDLVEIRTQHLIGRGHALVPGIGKLESLAADFVPGRDELGAVLGHADGADLVAHAQFVKQGQVGRQQGFADVEARMMRLFEQGDLVALLRQQRRHRAAAGAAADDQHVIQGVLRAGGGPGGVGSHGNSFRLRLPESGRSVRPVFARQQGNIAAAKGKRVGQRIL